MGITHEDIWIYNPGRKVVCLLGIGPISFLTRFTRRWTAPRTLVLCIIYHIYTIRVRHKIGRPPTPRRIGPRRIGPRGINPRTNPPRRLTPPFRRINPTHYPLSIPQPALRLYPGPSSRISPPRHP
jgi:hypothetical protein